jgi:hypothetical protein
MHSTNATRLAVSLTGAIDPMATEFVLRLDLSGHEHPGNPAAQHAVVRSWLANASQMIGSNLARNGALTIPVFDPSSGVNDHVKIGSWKFEDETRNPA